MNFELWEIFILTILSPILWIFSMVISVSVIAMIGAAIGIFWNSIDVCRKIIEVKFTNKNEKNAD